MGFRCYSVDRYNGAPKQGKERGLARFSRFLLLLFLLEGAPLRPRFGGGEIVLIVISCSSQYAGLEKVISFETLIHSSLGLAV